MKLTQAQLKKIIREELAAVMETQAGAGPADEGEGELEHEEAEEEDEAQWKRLSKHDPETRKRFHQRQARAKRPRSPGDYRSQKDRMDNP